MKKLLLFTAVALISAGTFAQGNSGKNKKDKKYETSDRRDNDGRDDDDDRYESKGNKKVKKNDRRYDTRNDDRSQRNRTYNNAKGVPAQVRRAFAADFPRATNVNWTKDSGTWTASFNRGGLLNNQNTATYRANGERIGKTGLF